jgi:hypothetical protein
MMKFGSDRDTPAEKWRWQIDRFVDDNQTELAALAWGLKQEWQDSDDTLGIDLQPQPHFVACSKEAIEQLNRTTKGHLQEILGLIDGYKPELEVLAIAIGNGQIKLIHFQPKITPPDCLAKLQIDIDTLITTLETRLLGYFV